MSGKKKTDWVYDELLCFLGNPFFQVPVLTFIEAHCLIFDPSEEDSEEYRKIHGKYKRVVQKLLDAFMQDSGLSHDEVIKALSDMNSKKDLREIFQGLFEIVLAMDDYKIFVGLMTQKNIELQQQALMLIIQTTGSLPDSLQEGSQQAPKPAASAESQDDEIMRKVMERSKREFDEEQKRKKKETVKDQDTVKDMLLVSKVEVSELEKQKKAGQEKLELAMSTLTTHEPVVEQVNKGSNKSRKMDPLPAHLPTVAPPPPKPVLIHQNVPGPTSPQISQTSLGLGLHAKPVMPGISSKEAADNWLKSAQDEATSGGAHSKAVQAAAAALSKLSPDELKKRQDYLRQQRDKLVEMKKKERERQLLAAEKDHPQRPVSAQVARQSLQEGGGGGGGEEKISPEEQKKMEMRRAIASKLKAELMGGQ